MGGKCWKICTSNVKANKKWAASKNQRETRLKRWDLFRLQRTSIFNAVLQGRDGMAQECVLIPLLSWWKQVSIWIHATTPDTLMLQGCWKPQTNLALKTMVPTTLRHLLCFDELSLRGEAWTCTNIPVCLRCVLFAHTTSSAGAHFPNDIFKLPCHLPETRSAINNKATGLLWVIHKNVQRKYFLSQRVSTAINYSISLPQMPTLPQLYLRSSVELFYENTMYHVAVTNHLFYLLLVTFSHFQSQIHSQNMSISQKNYNHRMRETASNFSEVFLNLFHFDFFLRQVLTVEFREASNSPSLSISSPNRGVPGIQLQVCLETALNNAGVGKRLNIFYYYCHFRFILLFYVYEYFACMSVTEPVCSWYLWRSEKGSFPIGLELNMFGSFHVGAGNQI